MQVVDHWGFTWVFMFLIIANTITLAMTTAGALQHAAPPLPASKPACPTVCQHWLEA
jgi:hypothetical protein